MAREGDDEVGIPEMHTARILNRLGWWSFALIFICMALFFVLATLMRPTADADPPSSDQNAMSIAAELCLAGVFVFGFLSFCLFIAAIIVNAASNRQILASGERAEAVILKIFETGTTISDSPVVRFLLQVTPQDEPQFQAEAERLVSA